MVLIFCNKNFLLVKSNFLHYSDVYEHGKLGISVTTSLIMALIKDIRTIAASLSSDDEPDFFCS